MENPKYAPLITGVKNIFIALILIGPALWLATLGKTTEMGLAIVASALAVSFISLDKISEFRGGGFSAKMKKTVKKAEVTTAQLRNLASPLISATAKTIAYNDRVSGLTRDDKHRLFDDLKTIAKTLSLENNPDLIESSHLIDVFDACDKFSNLIYDIHHPIARDELNKLFNNFQTTLANAPTKEQIDSIFSLYTIERTPEIEDKLSAYLKSYERINK